MVDHDVMPDSNFVFATSMVNKWTGGSSSGPLSDTIYMWYKTLENPRCANALIVCL